MKPKMYLRIKTIYVRLEGWMEAPQVSLLIAQQQFRFAVYTLITEAGPIRQRLRKAWTCCLASLEMPEAPRYLKDGFTRLKEEIERAVSQTDLAHGADFEESEEEATELARRVLSIFDDLSQTVPVSHQKHLFALLYLHKQQTQNHQK